METSEEVEILGSTIMDNLSKDSAEKHYEKLLNLHNSDLLTPAQKVNTFLHDLEHEILKEITGENEFFTQLDWLRNNQITVIRGQKTGRIPQALVSDIENLKKWRNEAQHENNMPILKYKSHLYTMAETIRFFSNIEWSVEMRNILNDIEIAGNRYEIKVEEIKINEGEVPQMVENKNENISKNQTIIEIKQNNDKKRIKVIDDLKKEEKWDSVHIFSEDGKYRYILGTKGEKPLIFFGINPSDATGFDKNDSDPTTTIINNLSSNWEYDSCFLINLYPQKGGEPRCLDKEIKNENIKNIKSLIEYIKSINKDGPSILAGWGNLDSRTKKNDLIEIYNEIKKIKEENIKWYNIKTKEGKLDEIHPPQPLRKSKEDIKEKEEFEIDEYIKKIKP